MTTGLPFDDFRKLMKELPERDESAADKVRSQFGQMDKPEGSLGKLEEIAEWLAGWTGRPPAVTRPLVAIFAGNHGIARRRVSPRAPDATAQMVEMCAAGGAAINQLCVSFDLGLKVFDLALHLPTVDFVGDAALDERGCAATMAFGMEAIAGGIDVIAIGDLGVGNSTVSAAVLAALYGGSGKDWVGPGSGADPEMVARKASTIDAALTFHGKSLKDPLEVLRRVGGREFAAIAGAIVAARMQKVAVVLDGFAATSASAVLHALNPAALDHCLAGHVSAEPGHAKALDRLGMKPLLDLRLSHGEGTGAALAIGVVKAAARVHAGMAARPAVEVVASKFAPLDRNE